MNFSALLNPTGPRQPAQPGELEGASGSSADPAAASSSSRMSFAFLDAAGSRPMTPLFAGSDAAGPASSMAAASPSAFQLHPSAQQQQPFMPYGAVDPTLLGVQPHMLVNPMALVQQPVAAEPGQDRGAVVADSDEEGSREPARQHLQGAPSAPAPAQHEADVDIMGAGNEEAALNALRAQGRASPAPKARTKPSQSKAKARSAQIASSAAGSPAPSPGPSSLANEVHPEGSPAPSVDATPAMPEVPDFSFLPDIAPEEYHHPHLAPGVPRARLPAAFEAYVPPRRSRFGPGQDDLSSSDEDEDEARRRDQRKKAAAAAARERRAKAAKGAGGPGEEEADDRLYCICQTLYDPERLMIACDRCEEWYHTDCVQIPEESADLVDLFICPKCSSKSLERTTWKPRCARPTCRHPAVPLSKYCSDYCGIAVAAARLSLYEADSEVEPISFWDKVRAATRREADTTAAVPGAGDAVEGYARQDEADARLRARIVSRLADADARQVALEAAVRLVEQRLAYLRIAIRRWEALCQATADEMASAGIDLEEVAAAQNTKSGGGGGGGRKGRGKRSGGSKKKGPVAATSLPDAQCGFDVRLVYDNEDWRATVKSAGVQAMLAAQKDGEDPRLLELALGDLDGICLETKKRCDRHTGWQKIREADFAVEKAVCDRRLDRMAGLRDSLTARLAQHDSTVAFRLANRSRTCAADKLIDVEDFMLDREEEEEDLRSPRQEERRVRSPSLRAHDTGGGGGKGHLSSAHARSRGATASHESTPAPNGTASAALAGALPGAVGTAPSGDVPDELLPFLSRAEQARIKAQRGRL